MEPEKKLRITNIVQISMGQPSHTTSCNDKFVPVLWIRIGSNADPEPAFFSQCGSGSREPNLCGSGSLFRLLSHEKLIFSMKMYLRKERQESRFIC
jgi:hypothetical protein